MALDAPGLDGVVEDDVRGAAVFVSRDPRALRLGCSLAPTVSGGVFNPGLYTVREICALTVILSIALDVCISVRLD
jgi:hypothetical protein